MHFCAPSGLPFSSLGQLRGHPKMGPNLGLPPDASPSLFQPFSDPQPDPFCGQIGNRNWHCHRKRSNAGNIMFIMVSAPRCPLGPTLFLLRTGPENDEKSNRKRDRFQTSVLTILCENGGPDWAPLFHKMRLGGGLKMGLVFTLCSSISGPPFWAHFRLPNC